MKFLSENVSLLLAAAEQPPIKRSDIVRRATWIGRVYLYESHQDEAVTNAELDDLLKEGLLQKVDQVVGITAKGRDALADLENRVNRLQQALVEVQKTGKERHQ